MRRLVIPGELVSEADKKIGTGVAREDGAVHSNQLGLLDEKENFVRVIPLSGGYNPKEVDFVIGVVSYVHNTFWKLDIASPYKSILPGGEFYRDLRGKERLRDIMPIGSAVYVKIKEVTKSKGVFTTLKWRGATVLKGGFLIEISPSKVPRLIGKKDSMIDILRSESGCEILAGQNGVIWVNGPSENMNLAIEAIRYIEANSHKRGLTDYVKNMLIEKRKSI